MALSDDQIADLVAGTLKDLGRGRYTELATDLQGFEVLPRVLKKGKINFIANGTGVQRNIMIDDGGAAKHVGLFSEDVTSAPDHLAQYTVPWRHSQTHWVFDRRETQMNSGPSAIVDMVKMRRAGAMISLAKLMEQSFFGKPVDSSDNITPFGLDYWITPSQTQGFNGGNPSGFAAGAGGIDSAAYPRWANYTDGYTTVNKADLITKMRKAHRLTNFVSPISIPDYRKGAGQNFRIYVNEVTIAALETLGEAQNENLGRDLASMDGMITFRKNPLVYVPYLDADTTDPVRMINWNSFHINFLKGEYLRQDGPQKKADAHNVFEAHIDLTWNTDCDNRRLHADIRKSSS